MGAAVNFIVTTRPFSSLLQSRSAKGGRSLKPDPRVTRLVAAVALLTCGCQQMESMAESDSMARPAATASDTVKTQATVIAVNRPEREVVLRNEDGTVMGFILDDRVRNFDQIEVGDVVTAEYHQAIAVTVEPSTGEPTASTAASMQRAPLGAKPGGTATRVSTLTAKVEDVDYDSRLVTLRGPSGQIREMKVGPEVENLQAVRKGDQVLVRHTEAIAIAVSK
jgi:hypothetical protein